MLINLLQRHHLWVFIFLSGLSGLALGHLGATSIGLFAGPAPIPAQFIQSTANKPSTRAPLRDYQAILARDIFNSAGGAQNLNQIETAQPQIAKPIKTASKWTLIGTISGGATPLATLEAAKEISTYHLHDQLPDSAVLDTIERNKVELKYPDGRRQVLELNLDPPPNKNIRQKPAVSQKNNSQRIEALGNNQWHIPLQVAEDARTNIGSLLSQAQAFPYLEGEKTTGFQIRMIRPGSLIAQLGLKKGDILREINGLPLNSPEKALQIFGQLRQARQVSISLERGGNAMTFAYEIR